MRTRHDAPFAAVVSRCPLQQHECIHRHHIALNMLLLPVLLLCCPVQCAPDRGEAAAAALDALTSVTPPRASPPRGVADALLCCVCRLSRLQVSPRSSWRSTIAPRCVVPSHRLTCIDSMPAIRSCGQTARCGSVFCCCLFQCHCNLHARDQTALCAVCCCCLCR